MAKTKLSAQVVADRKTWLLATVNAHIDKYEVATRGLREDAEGKPLKSGYTQVISALPGRHKEGDEQPPSLENVIMSGLSDEFLVDQKGDTRREKVRALIVSTLANHPTLYAEPVEHTYGERSQAPGVTITTVKVGRRSVSAAWAAPKFA